MIRWYALVINAKQVSRTIRNKADTLADFPHIGKMIPEIGNDNLREIHVHSWRIFYQLRDNNIHIIAVIHQRRDLMMNDVIP